MVYVEVRRSAVVVEQMLLEVARPAARIDVVLVVLSAPSQAVAQVVYESDACRLLVERMRIAVVHWDSRWASSTQLRRQRDYFDCST